MSSSVFQNMAPNAKKSLVVTLLFGAAAIGIYMFGVQPAEDALTKARREHDDEDSRLQMVNKNLHDVTENKNRLDKLEADLKPFRDAMLEPLLGNYAMRARSILDPMAADAGLSNRDYSESATMALPLVALQSMNIIADPKPDKQKIEMVFEWPAKGAMTK